MEHTFESSVWIDCPLEQCFSFFADPENLERITPKQLSFKIEGAVPEYIKQGLRINYRLKIRALPIRWISEITAWEPPHRFVDVQLKGPYKKWIHEHRFTEENGGTRISDSVRYEVPGFFLEPLIHKFFVKPDLIKIFNYREKIVSLLLTKSEKRSI